MQRIEVLREEVDTTENGGIEEAGVGVRENGGVKEGG